MIEVPVIVVGSKLRQRFSISRVCIVVDRGMISAEMDTAEPVMLDAHQATSGR
jgi:hypothetical protein